MKRKPKVPTLADAPHYVRPGLLNGRGAANKPRRGAWLCADEHHTRAKPCVRPH